MTGVFISYAPSDEVAAQRVIAELRGHGISVSHAAASGDPFPHLPSPEIRRADAVIGLLSRAALTDRKLRGECRIARARGVLVLANLEPVDVVGEVAGDFGGLPVTELAAANERSFRDGVRKLVRTLSPFMAKPRAGGDRQGGKRGEARTWLGHEMRSFAEAVRSLVMPEGAIDPASFAEWSGRATAPSLGGANGSLALAATAARWVYTSIVIFGVGVAAWSGVAILAKQFPKTVAFSEPGTSVAAPVPAWSGDSVPIALSRDDDGKWQLVDQRGAILNGVKPEMYVNLIRISGANANTAAPLLIATLQNYPNLGERADTAYRIGDRRWNITFRGTKTEVFLPEDARLKDQLEALNLLQAQTRALDIGAAHIDMRMEKTVAVGK